MLTQLDYDTFLGLCVSVYSLRAHSRLQVHAASLTLVAQNKEAGVLTGPALQRRFCPGGQLTPRLNLGTKGWRAC